MFILKNTEIIVNVKDNFIKKATSKNTSEEI